MLEACFCTTSYRNESTTQNMQTHVGIRIKRCCSQVHTCVQIDSFKDTFGLHRGSPGECWHKNGMSRQQLLWCPTTCRSLLCLCQIKRHQEGLVKGGLSIAGYARVQRRTIRCMICHTILQERGRKTESEAFRFSSTFLLYSIEYRCSKALSKSWQDIQSEKSAGSLWRIATAFSICASAMFCLLENMCANRERNPLFSLIL